MAEDVRVFALMPDRRLLRLTIVRGDAGEPLCLACQAGSVGPNVPIRVVARPGGPRHGEYLTAAEDLAVRLRRRGYRRVVAGVGAAALFHPAESPP